MKRENETATGGADDTAPQKRGPKVQYGDEAFAHVFEPVRTGEGTIVAIQNEGMSVSQFYARLEASPELKAGLEAAILINRV